MLLTWGALLLKYNIFTSQVLRYHEDIYHITIHTKSLTSAER